MEDAVHTAILTLKEGMDGVLTPSMIEVGICERVLRPCRDGGEEMVDVFRVLSEDEVKDYLANIV